MNKMFHVYNEGENVLFRQETDYIFFNNKFALSCHSLHLQALAQTTMSTHFHSMTETIDESAIDELIFRLRKSYSLYYAFKYGYTLDKAFRILKIEITGREFAINELLYIMKNPVHHYVAGYPFEYPFSSVSYIFSDKLILSYYQEAIKARIITADKLSYRRRRLVAGTDIIPPHWEVLDNNLILPSSYINIPRVKAFWNNNVKAFIFDINKNQTDARKEIINADILDLRTSGLNDISVCRIIDTFSQEAGHKSFHQLTSTERQTLIRILKQKGVGDGQIQRCMWG